MKDNQLIEPVECDLVGVDGNCFALMGYWSECARKSGRSKEEIDKVLKEAMSSDYNHLLMTLAIHSKG